MYFAFSTDDENDKKSKVMKEYFSLVLEPRFGELGKITDVALQQYLEENQHMLTSENEEILEDLLEGVVETFELEDEENNDIYQVINRFSFFLTECRAFGVELSNSPIL